MADEWLDPEKVLEPNDLPALREERKRIPFSEAELDTIANFSAAGMPRADIAAMFSVKRKRIENLLDRKANKKFNMKLASARNRQLMACNRYHTALQRDDIFELAMQAIRDTLTQTKDPRLRWEAAQDVAGMWGVQLKRESGPSVAMQMNVQHNAPPTPESERADKELAKATLAVTEGIAALARSLGTMEDSPHITTTGIGQQLGDEFMRDEDVIDVTAEKSEENEA